MVDRSNISGLGMVAVAMVSTGVILASYYHLRRRLESNHKLNKNNIEQRQQSRTAKKKVRFAALPVDTLSGGDELRCASAGAGGKLAGPALRKVARSSDLPCLLSMVF